MNLKHNTTTKYNKWNNKLLRKGKGGILTTQKGKAKTLSNNTP
jgi:hypothetical protein